MGSGRQRWGIAALGLALVTIGAWFAPRGRTGARHAAPATPAVQLGRLQFQPCEIGGHGADGVPTLPAYCTRVEVPEDWQAPHGRHIGLRVALIRADAARPDPDLVTFLDGGPGGAATADYPLVAAALAPLVERHDLLLIDQRGTGGSNALSCPALQADGASAGDESAAQRADARPEALRSMLQRCLAALRGRAAPEDYTTSETVRDLEAVREAIGAPPLDLMGVSYGTLVAQEYLRRYPRAVRSMVLDSPVPVTLVLLSQQSRNLERALKADFALCTRTPACRQRFGDPYATLYRLRARLLAHPQVVQLRDPVSYASSQVTFTAQDLATVVRFDAYSSASAALLPLLLQQADQGRYGPLLGQKRWLSDDLADQITSGLQLSVLCAEDVDLLRPQPADADTLLGDGAIERAREACSVWPRGRRPADFHAPLHSSIPTLILSGALDPVTPPAYGLTILAGLSDARQLIAPGEGHGVIGAGCMPRLVQRFVTTLHPAALDAACLSRLAAPPAFLGYNGAGP